MTLPTNDAERQEYPLSRGLFRYFPDALAEVSRRSYTGAAKHTNGRLWWDRSESRHHDDSMLRHLMDAHAYNRVEDYAAVAWRALAMLQRHMELHDTKQDKPKDTRPDPQASSQAQERQEEMDIKNYCDAREGAKEMDIKKYYDAREGAKAVHFSKRIVRGNN